MKKKTLRTRSNTAKVTKIYRDKVIFKFEIDGKTYNNNQGRMKIAQEGYISFLIKEDNKWKPKKGKLLQLKVVKEVCGLIKGKTS